MLCFKINFIVYLHLSRDYKCEITNVKSTLRIHLLYYSMSQNFSFS